VLGVPRKSWSEVLFHAPWSVNASSRWSSHAAWASSSACTFCLTLPPSSYTTWPTIQHLKGRTPYCTRAATNTLPIVLIILCRLSDVLLCDGSDRCLLVLRSSPGPGCQWAAPGRPAASLLERHHHSGSPSNRNIASARLRVCLPARGRKCSVGFMAEGFGVGGTPDPPRVLLFTSWMWAEVRAHLWSASGWGKRRLRIATVIG